MTLSLPEVLFLDAGNTLVFLDMGAVARAVASVGVALEASALAAVEGLAKRRYEARLSEGAGHAGGWDDYMATLLGEAGAPEARIERAVEALKAAHAELNLWRSVPSGLVTALDRAREGGVRLAVISNSEGKLPELFEHVGLGDYFEHVVDSAIEGVSKPNPVLFERALERMGVEAAEALYAGDIPSVDVEGARAVGMQAALIDPYDFYPGYGAAPRYASVEELVTALFGSG